MTFQLSAPNPLHSEAIRAQATQLVRIDAPAQLRPVLPVGKILDVVVGDNGRGQLGLMMQGQFYPALLPKGYRPGDALRVQVQASEEVLVLRILGNRAELGSPATNPKPVSSPLQQLFSFLLPKDRQAHLEQAARSLHIAQQGILRFEDPALGVSKDSGSIPAVIKNLISRLSQKDSLLTEETLSAQNRVMKVLSNFTERSLQASVAEARQAVELLAKGASKSPLERLARALVQHLEQLASQSEPNGLLGQRSDTPAATGSSRIQQNLSLSALVSQYAIADGNTDLLARVSQVLGGRAERDPPLLLLLKILSSGTNFAPPEEAGVSSFERVITTAIKDLLRELSAHKHDRSEDALVKASVQKAILTLRTALQEDERHSSYAGTAAHAGRAAKLLEQLLSGQDVLNQMNPLLRSIGEPSMIMIPVLIGGHLTPLEILLHPPRVDGEEEQKKNDSLRQNFSRVELRLNLPFLGPVGVDVALRKEEFLATFTSPRQEVVDAVEDSLGELELRIRERGFSSVVLRSQAGSVESNVVPMVVSDRASVAIV